MARIQGQLQALQENLEALAGESVAGQVMAGREALKDSTKPEKVAAWVQGALDRLDALAGAETAAEVMSACGRNCAAHNATALQRGLKRRAKFLTLDAFLDAEAADPQTGTRLAWEGNVITQVYTPQTFTHPLRCYCSLLRGLPADQVVSPTYCQCSRAFVETYWTGIIGQPVQVELRGSAISGAEECTFVIHLPG